MRETWAHLEMLHRQQSHAVHHEPQLPTQDLRDGDILTGVMICRQYPLAYDFVHQPALLVAELDHATATRTALRLRCLLITVDARYGEESRVRRREDPHRLVLGREAGQVQHCWEYGVLEDLRETGLPHGLRGTFCPKGLEDG